MNKRFAWMPYVTVFALLLFVVACAQNTPEAVFNRGMQDFEAGNIVTASIHFDDFVTKFPDNERTLGAYVMLTRCHMQLRDYISARRVFEEIQENFPSPTVILQSSAGIGQTYVSEGNFDSAERVFQSIVAAATEPQTYVEAYSSLADIKSRQSQTEEAIAYMDKIIQYADDEIDDPTETANLKFFAHENSAQIYMASQQFQEARGKLAAALSLAENATDIIGHKEMRQRAVVNWAHTWVAAEDYVTAATMYDVLQTNIHIMDEIKPQLIVWKIQSLERLFQQDDGEWSAEERAFLSNEHHRFIEEFDNTDYSINARVRIAGLIFDTTPEEAERYVDEAVERLQLVVAEPPSVDASIGAMRAIFEAYLTVNKFDDAMQTAEQLKNNFSDVPQVVQFANQMLQGAEQMRLAQAAAAEAEAETEEESQE